MTNGPYHKTLIYELAREMGKFTKQEMMDKMKQRWPGHAPTLSELTYNLGRIHEVERKGQYYFFRGVRS